MATWSNCSSDGRLCYICSDDGGVCICNWFYDGNWEGTTNCGSRFNSLFRLYEEKLFDPAEVSNITEDRYRVPRTTYDPEVGLFINTLQWGTASSGSWKFSALQGHAETYQLQKNGSVVDTLTINGASAVRWIFFPRGNFLAVRNATRVAGYEDYRMWIFDLRGSTVMHYEVGASWTLSAGAQLHFHPSQDGMAFFAFAGDSPPNSTSQHMVFRTDTGAVLCSWGSIFNVMGQRMAEITAARTVRILTSPGAGGPTVYAECRIPNGN